VTDITYLEHLVNRFLRNAEDRGARESGNRGVNVSGHLTRALETARSVHDALSDRSRVLAWRAIHGLEATFEFPPLPKPIERPSFRGPAGPPQIVICDPARVRDPKHDVLGFVQEKKADRGGSFAEVSVLDADLILYPFQVPMREVPIPHGALARARILRKTDGPTAWFCCTRLWLLEIHELERPQWPVPKTPTESTRRSA